ncbi:hypothetical protein CN894_05290 [Bacillus thuringiensis]|uniref:hypothetical protein n=1 Tax=Bacillus thuringiensis TaxID=1428 RepID=UPI000BF772D9|nr:hypothetical protein [Bacillus thuringiensis]PFN50731.1 hypothetical protein COJ58_19535 [Bacillus thuringiensis]PGH74932.1 hypothetical protein CN894_05290 [Bacillus thuringiensis]
MKFLEQHPNYTAYIHEEYDMSSLPFTLRRNDLNILVHACLASCSQDDDLLLNTYRLQNELAAELQDSPCENAHYDYMKDEIIRVLDNSRRQFSSFMDGLSVIIRVTQELDRVNEFLQGHSIGYVAEWGFRDVSWIQSDGTENQVASLVEAVETIPDDFQNTNAHIRQAITQLQDSQDERSRKDALRDALSAVEAYVKYVSGKNSIYSSCRELTNMIQAPDASFISEGADLWNEIHETYPDIRHGNEARTVLELPEALYYIERLMCYLKYIHRKLN